jgi:hypothetical protein
MSAMSLARARDVFRIGQWVLDGGSDLASSSRDDDIEAVLVAILRVDETSRDRLADLLRVIRSDHALSKRVPENFIGWCVQFFADTERRARIIAAVDTGEGIIRGLEARAEQMAAAVAALIEARDELNDAVAFFSQFLRASAALAEAA